MNLKNVEDELMNQFANMAISDGEISLKDFAKYLGIPESEPALIELFNLYDKVNIFFLVMHEFNILRYLSEIYHWYGVGTFNS